MLKADQAMVFAALGDPVRLELLAKIGEGGTITELAAELPITRQAVTRHLGVLEKANLIQGKRKGREVRFTPRPARLVEAKGWLSEVAGQWEQALARLKAHVERIPSETKE
ncbi:MAG: metalloregulator ArsR/SmtB family transcription factor [Pseudomonadota bacterium]